MYQSFSRITLLLLSDSRMPAKTESRHIGPLMGKIVCGGALANIAPMQPLISRRDLWEDYWPLNNIWHRFGRGCDWITNPMASWVFVVLWANNGYWISILDQCVIVGSPTAIPPLRGYILRHSLERNRVALSTYNFYCHKSMQSKHKT